jgi:hypothetical protein
LPDGVEGSFALEVVAPGFERLHLEELVAGSLPDPWGLTLRALPGIRGRVLAGGEPLVRANVHLSWRAAAGKVLKKGNSITGLVGSFS